jgi:excisionase family DNA binding protein
MRSLQKGNDAGDKDPRFYSVADVADIFGMSEMTVYRAIREGEFPAIKIRGRLIIPAKVVDEMANAAVDSREMVNAADWLIQSGVS